MHHEAPMGSSRINGLHCRVISTSLCSFSRALPEPMDSVAISIPVLKSSHSPAARFEFRSLPASIRHHRRPGFDRSRRPENLRAERRVHGRFAWRNFSEMEPEEKEFALMDAYQNLISDYLPYTGACPVRESSASRIKYFITFFPR